MAEQLTRNEQVVSSILTSSSSAFHLGGGRFFFCIFGSCTKNKINRCAFLKRWYNLWQEGVLYV